MTQQTNPTPDKRPQSNKPQSGGPQAPATRRDDDTKIPGGDTTGEMEDSGGGRKTGSRPDDPTRSTRGGGSIPPGKPAPIVPKRDADDEEAGDVEEGGPMSGDRGRSKQQGC